VDHAACCALAAEARARVAGRSVSPLRALEGVELGFALALLRGRQRNCFRSKLAGRPCSAPDVLSALAVVPPANRRFQLESPSNIPIASQSRLPIRPGRAHPWTLGISVELPIFTKIRAPSLSQSETRRTAARFLAVQAKVIADMTGAGWRAAAMEQMQRQGELTKLAHEQSAAAENLLKRGASDKPNLPARNSKPPPRAAYLDPGPAQQAVAQSRRHSTPGEPGPHPNRAALRKQKR